MHLSHLSVEPAARRSSRGQRRAWLAALLGLPALLAAAVMGLRAWTDRSARSATHALAQVPARSVAIVFGAGYWPGYGLSAVLEDRVVTAAELYHSGKVQKLLMSGDNRTLDYNEPGAMRDRALDLGVPDKDIVLDYAGRRTYDSCYRARAIFGVQDAVLVTQAYHLDRALFTARRLGLDVVGLPADRRDYQYIQRYAWRELAATAVAWWQVTVTHPLPVLGEPLPIFP